jgi:GT2 family glycosyltransferase
MTLTTDIIVVLYGDTKDYDRLVKSIQDNCNDYNLITIDNNQENRGFTKANNEGIKQGTSPYIWLLNQDAVLLPGAQEGLIMRLNAHKKNGIAGSMQIDYDNHDLIRHGGTVRAFPGGVHKGGLISMGHCRFPEKQTWVNFASVMFKREMINDIGYLDESMFLIYSDSDYCYTARQKGWAVWYEPSSKVYHRLNTSKTVTEWHKKDMEAFMKKWDIKVLPDNNLLFGREFERLNKFP